MKILSLRNAKCYGTSSSRCDSPWLGQLDIHLGICAFQSFARFQDIIPTCLVQTFGCLIADATQYLWVYSHMGWNKTETSRYWSRCKSCIRSTFEHHITTSVTSITSFNYHNYLSSVHKERITRQVKLSP